MELLEIKEDFKAYVDNLYEARYFDSDSYSVPEEVRDYYLLASNDIRMSIGRWLAFLC